MTEDPRLTAAKELLASIPIERPEEQVIQRVIDYAEERLRVNVGLLNEIGSLKAKLRSTEDEIASAPAYALFAELQRRGLITIT